jgi:hypothetical protein
LLCGLFWMWICSSDVGFSDGEPDWKVFRKMN